MYRRKYGRMTAGAWLSAEMEQSNPTVMILCGALLCAGGILSRALSGSPYRVMLELGIGEIVPPVWLMTVLWCLAFFTVGAAAGFVLSARPRGCEGEKYKGGMLFVLLAVAELLWYPTLFCGGWVFLSALESVLILCLSVCVTVCFFRISGLPGIILVFHDVWLIYLLFLNFSIFFRN